MYERVVAEHINPEDNRFEFIQAVLKASGWSTVGSAKLTVQNTNPLNQVF